MSSQPHMSFPVVEMTQAGNPYTGWILHSALIASVVAWGHLDIDLEGGVFISFNPEVFIFKSTLSLRINLYLVLQGTEHDEPVMIDLKDNILVQDEERLNVLACMKDAPSARVWITFSDVASAEDFETWMHAALSEVAAEKDMVPVSMLLQLLSCPRGIEYDKECDVFPELERLAGDNESETLED
ncbi:hypothetical protein V8D89_001503 [Ganoderma adspersum]